VVFAVILVFSSVDRLQAASRFGVAFSLSSPAQVSTLVAFARDVFPLLAVLLVSWWAVACCVAQAGPPLPQSFVYPPFVSPVSLLSASPLFPVRLSSLSFVSWLLSCVSVLLLCVCKVFYFFCSLPPLPLFFPSGPRLGLFVSQALSALSLAALDLWLASLAAPVPLDPHPLQP
jgi:hypothetical protein